MPRAARVERLSKLSHLGACAPQQQQQRTPGAADAGLLCTCASRNAVLMSSASPGSRLPPGKHTSPAAVVAGSRRSCLNQVAGRLAHPSGRPFCGTACDRLGSPANSPQACTASRSPLCVLSLLERWLSTTCTSPVAGSSNKGTSTAANLPDTCWNWIQREGTAQQVNSPAAAMPERQAAADNSSRCSNCLKLITQTPAAPAVPWALASRMPGGC